MTEIREEITIQERVSNICNDLYVKGNKPTIRLVLSMMPDIKSTSTIHKYFTMWKKEQVANQASLYDKLGFSSDFTQSFMKEITRFSVEAEQRYQEQAQDAVEQKDIAIEELSRTEEKLYKQTAVIEQHEKVFKELETDLFKTQSQHKADIEAQKSTHEVLVAELRQQLLDETGKNTELSKSNESLRTDIAKAELKLEGNAEFVAEVKGQNQALQEDNKRLNKVESELSRAIATLEATVIGNNKLITNYEANHKVLQDNLTGLEKERLEFVIDSKKLNRDIEDLNSSLANTKELLSNEKVKAAELKAAFDEQVINSNLFTSELKSSHDDQVRNLNSSISNHEKLILQLELHQDTLETEKVELIKKIYGLNKEEKQPTKESTTRS